MFETNLELAGLQLEREGIEVRFGDQGQRYWDLGHITQHQFKGGCKFVVPETILPLPLGEFATRHPLHHPPCSPQGPCK